MKVLDIFLYGMTLKSASATLRIMYSMRHVRQCVSCISGRVFCSLCFFFLFHHSSLMIAVFVYMKFYLVCIQHHTFRNIQSVHDPYSSRCFTPGADFYSCPIRSNDQLPPGYSF